MPIAFRGFGWASLFACVLAAATTAPGQERGREPDDAPAPVLSFQSENDLYGDARDRWYTNGFRLSFAYPAGGEPEIFAWADSLLPSDEPGKDTDVFFAVGQAMFTPRDITADRLLADDRPYAGWLYLELGASGGTDRLQETLTLSAGTTGPPSMAKRTQQFVHTLTDSPEPQGWEFQLEAEPTLQLFYERSWFLPLGRIAGETEIDLSPRLGGNLGNVFIDANAGLVARIGNYLPPGLPPRLNPSATGTGTTLRPRKEGIGWFVFAGIEARGVARNLFLDGNSFTDSHSVAKENFVYEASAGIAASFDAFALSYTFVHRSEEFDLQREPQSFGSINLSLAF